LTWLDKCDNYFRGHRVSEDEKVWMAHLDGLMALVQNGTIRWNVTSSWFLGHVSSISSTSASGHPYMPILSPRSRLCFTGTVEEYSWCYLALVSHCNYLSTCTKLDLYTGGLGQPLDSNVEMQHPTNLQHAMNLARAYEQRQ
jgi:hypothetical protein